MPNDLNNDDGSIPENNQTSVSDSDSVNPPNDELERDPFEELASEFSERHRRGEMPSVEEYARKYPELAEEIRDLFPTIATMEQLKERKAPAKPADGGLQLEQLGDFRILGEIGRGGMGVVYEAEQVSLGRHVAVKVLPKQALLDERHLRRFEREAQTAAKLHHTNIVPVFGVGQQDGFHYIVMQFIPGVGLDEILISLRTTVLNDDSARFHMDSSSRASHANHNAQALLDGNFGRKVSLNLASSFVKDTKKFGSGTESIGGEAATMELASGAAMSGLSGSSVTEGGGDANGTKPLDADNSKVLASMDSEYYQSVAKIGQQVADALAYAHEQGTLHRDIKPGNLLLDATGTVWVADFGLAKLAEQDNVSRTGDIVGTLSYMPPESFSGETDARGDIYALGLTLYEMLAMRPAYFGRDRGRIVKQITEGDLPRLGKLNPGIPRDLETIVIKAIEQHPDDRYATARDLEEDLQSYLHDMPIKARRMSVPEQFTRWCRKNKLVASLSAAVATLLMVSSVTFGFLNYQANEARKDLQVQKDVAEKQTEIAKKQEQLATEAGEMAKNTAKEAIAALLKIFDGFAPDRLPPTADQTLQADASEELTADSLVASETDDETTQGDAADDTAVATVAAAPVTAETAARLEVLLQSFDSLAKGAGNDEDFAPIFADLTIRVGKLHRMLGNNDEALERFDDGIAKYESILENGPAVASVVVGLASSYNEKGDVTALVDNRSRAFSIYSKSLELFKSHKDLLDGSPRAIYEKARTLFLMSLEYKGRGNMGRGRRGSGRGPGGSRGGGFSGRGEGARSPGPFGGWRVQSLKTAIGLLEGLVQTESNPEYRYLLARCYTSVAINSHNPQDGEQRVESIQKAIQNLELLVRDQPAVADYKFEYAVAKFFELDIQDYTPQKEFEITQQIVDVTREITTQNPAISNYAFLHSRALFTHTQAIDRLADEIQIRGGGDLLEMRSQTIIAMQDAIESLSSLRTRFPNVIEDFNERLPEEKELAFHQDKLRWKRTVAEAMDLKRDGKQTAARELLLPLRASLTKQASKHIDEPERRRGPGRGQGQGQLQRIYEYLQLIAAIENELKGIDATRSLLAKVRTAQLKAKQKGREPVSWVDEAELDMAHARILKWIGAGEIADQEFERIEKQLTESMTNSRDRLTSGGKFQPNDFQTLLSSTRLLEQLFSEARQWDKRDSLRQQRNELREKMTHVRSRFPRGRGGPGGGRPNDNGRRGDGDEFEPDRRPPGPDDRDGRPPRPEDEFSGDRPEFGGPEFGGPEFGGQGRQGRGPQGRGQNGRERGQGGGGFRGEEGRGSGRPDRGGTGGQRRGLRPEDRPQD